MHRKDLDQLAIERSDRLRRLKAVLRYYAVNPLRTIGAE